tara:strand:- start:944 stop:2251 length:1308 start_codon:yes stop_codon:yes gene_type:complete
MKLLKTIESILKESTISTTSRKERANWSPEAIQDLEAFHPELKKDLFSMEDIEMELDEYVEQGHVTRGPSTTSRENMSSEAKRWIDKNNSWRFATRSEGVEVDFNNLPDTINELVDKNLYKSLELNKGGEFNEDEELDEMSIEDLENGSFNKGKYYTIQSPSKWIQEELGEDLKYWSYDIKKNNLGQDLEESNEEEDLDEYRFDFYEEDTRDCPKGMYYCSDDKICKPDSQKLDEALESGTGVYGQDTPSELFFIAVKLLLAEIPEPFWDIDNHTSDPLYERRDLIAKVVKVLGIKGSDDLMMDKLFWAGLDNLNGFNNGTVEKYSDLYLRPLNNYSVPMEVYETVYRQTSWEPEVTAYDSQDVETEVIYDEDNYYDHWEWEGNKYNYLMEDQEIESSEGNMLNGSPHLIEQLNPGQNGNRTSSGYGSGLDLEDN